MIVNEPYWKASEESLLNYGLLEIFETGFGDFYTKLKFGEFPHEQNIKFIFHRHEKYVEELLKYWVWKDSNEFLTSVDVQNTPRCRLTN